MQGTDIILAGGAAFVLFLCARLVAAACLPESHWFNRANLAGLRAEEEDDLRRE